MKGWRCVFLFSGGKGTGAKSIKYVTRSVISTTRKKWGPKEPRDIYKKDFLVFGF